MSTATTPGRSPSNNSVEDLAPVHLLIVNQHGDNRGDEAALRAMLRTFAEMLEARGRSVRFTVVHQSRDRVLRLRFDEEVAAIPMLLPIPAALGFALRSGLHRLFGKIPRWLDRLLLTEATTELVAAYRSADLVVSAPGGPYFGDIYRDHELVHWFFVWLAGSFGKRSFLYATSAGPFRTPGLNALRRRMFRRFDGLCVRENQSAQLLRKLCGEELTIEVTADSALQQKYSPFLREEIFGPQRQALRERFLVSLTALRYAFPEHRDPTSAQEAFENAWLAGVEHLARRRQCHFLLLPQLYGESHSDVAYLEQLAGRLPASVSWEVVDPEIDAHGHQRIVAMTDFSIACRYHPQIFAAAGEVPGVCVYYEHKASSFMSALGLEDFALSIRTIDAESLCATIDRALGQSSEILTRMAERMPELRRQARRTTELALELCELSPRTPGGMDP